MAGRVCCCWVGAGAERAGTMGRDGAERPEDLDWRGMVIVCVLGFGGVGVEVCLLRGEED